MLAIQIQISSHLRSTLKIDSVTSHLVQIMFWHDLGLEIFYPIYKARNTLIVKKTISKSVSHNSVVNFTLHSENQNDSIILY